MRALEIQVRSRIDEIRYTIKMLIEFHDLPLFSGLDVVV